MGNFRDNNRSGGRRGGSGFGGGRDSGRPQMHRAVCSDCGNDCEVPFKPTGSKPIYCSDCFSNKGHDEPRRSGGRDSGRFNSGDRKMYEVVCDKCNKNCEVPFKPSSDKPIYCSDCFGGGDKGKSRDRDRGGSKPDNKQLEMINIKLDQILKALGVSAPVEVKKKTETVVVKPEIIAKPKKEVKSKVKKAVAPKKKVVAKKTKAKKK